MCRAVAQIVEAAELARRGLTRRQIAHEQATGTLLRLRTNVFAQTGTCVAVRVAATHGGSIACVTAARHIGIWTLSGSNDVHVWMRGHGHRHRHPDCSCVEHWDGLGGRNAFGTPSVPRLLRQIFLCRGVEEFYVSLESALHLGLLARDGLDWLRAHCGNAVRDAISFARTDAESGLESLLRWRMRWLGITLSTQVDIPSVGRVDFLLGDRLILEVDGVGNHDGRSNRHKDLIRDANAAAWGFSTLRFDYAMVVHDWPTVVAAILGHLGRGIHLDR